MERLSEIAVTARICPRRVLWPKAGSSPFWAAAHDCVHAYEKLIRDVESECIALERENNLSPEAKRRGYAEACERSLARLFEFTALERVHNMLSERVRALEKLDSRSPHQVSELNLIRQASKELEHGAGAAERTIRLVCGSAGRTYPTAPRRGAA
jgi:hypothetical protein